MEGDQLSGFADDDRANRRNDPEFGRAIVLNDTGGWLRRPDPARFHGEAHLADRPRAQEMWRAFDRSWDRAQAETAVRALKL
mgnify:CR=1 FL=1